MRTVHKRHSDPQRARPDGYCTCCGRELYAGTLRWKLWGNVLCRECVVSWVLNELSGYCSCGGEVRR